MPKPSFGCMACRKRKVKCDERIGGCLRCERYRTRCPGYQNPIDVLLRHYGDEKTTSSRDGMHIRLDVQVTGNGRPDQAPHSVWNLMKTASTMLRPQPHLVRQPPIDVDQAALGAYYSAYCVSSATICSLDHVRQQGNGCLWAAIKMLGMLQLNQTWQLSGGLDTLLRQYTHATTLLNTAIASAAESREDRTLLATLMLSVVEMKASPDFSLRYWLMHTNGAAALMEFRGADQILSRMGAALFFQMSSQIVIYSLLGKRHIPGALDHLRDMIRPYVISNNHPLWQWHGLMYRFANLWATASTTKPQLTPRDAQTIIIEALSIYNEMDVVFQAAGTYWEYATRPSNEFRPLISHEHIYHSLLTTRVWTDRRTSTILLFTIISQLAAYCHRGGIRLDKDPQLYMSYAHDVIQHTALEILAAVPQVLASLQGKSLAHESSSLAPPPGLCDSNSEYDERVFQHTRQDLPILPYMDSCRVQWSVYFAVQCELVDVQIRRRLLEVLECSGKIMQIQQWHILAENLKSTLESSSSSSSDKDLYDSMQLGRDVEQSA